MPKPASANGLCPTPKPKAGYEQEADETRHRADRQSCTKGFRHEDRRAIAQGLQEQLTRLLSQPGMAQRLSQAGNVPRLRVGDVNMAADAKPQQVGIAAANGIGKGLNR